MAAPSCAHCGLPIRIWQDTWVHDSGARYCFSTAAEPVPAYALTREEVRIVLGWWQGQQYAYTEHDADVPPPEESELAKRIEEAT